MNLETMVYRDTVLSQTAKRGKCTPEVRLDFLERTPGLHLNICIARLAPVAGAIKNTTKKYMPDEHNFQQSHQNQVNKYYNRANRANL